MHGGQEEREKNYMITMASHVCVNNDQQRLQPGTEDLDFEIREGGLGNLLFGNFQILGIK